MSTKADVAKWGVSAGVGFALFGGLIITAILCGRTFSPIDSAYVGIFMGVGLGVMGLGIYKAHQAWENLPSLPGKDDLLL